MFSLIITIISIALVTALALATIYYGGSAYRQGQDKATAAQLVNEGQQIIGAADLFNAERGRWPNSLGELVTEHYLGGIPPGYAMVQEFSLISSAYAATTGWEAVTPSVPTFQLTAAVPEGVCRFVNLSVQGSDGIPAKAYANAVTQCYHSAASNSDRVVVTRMGETLATVLPVGDVADAAANFPTATAADPSVWFAAPTPATAAASPPTGGTTGGGWSLTVSGGPNFNFADTTLGSSGTLPLSIYNSGADTLTLDASSVAVLSPGLGFSVSPGGNTPCSGNLPPAQSCTYVATFSPITAGLKSTVVQIIPTGKTYQNTSQSLQLSGTGKAIGAPEGPITFSITQGLTPVDTGLGSSHTGISFKDTPAGTAPSVVLTVTNTSANAGAVHPAFRAYYFDSNLDVSSTTCGNVMQPNESCQVTVTYQVPAGGDNYFSTVYPYQHNPGESWLYSFLTIQPGAGATTATDTVAPNSQALMVYYSVGVAAPPPPAPIVAQVSMNWSASGILTTMSAVSGGSTADLVADSSTSDSGITTWIRGTQGSFVNSYNYSGAYSNSPATFTATPSGGAVSLAQIAPAASTLTLSAFHPYGSGNAYSADIPSTGGQSGTWCVTFQKNMSVDAGNNGSSRWQGTGVVGACH